jgi:hypothetical protein
MDARETSERNKDIMVRIPMTPRERRRFDAAMRRGSHVRGRWIKGVIFKELDRAGNDGDPKDAV